MDLWELETWRDIYKDTPDQKTGLRLRIDTKVPNYCNAYVKSLCNKLRANYYFPIRVPVYVWWTNRLKLNDNSYANGLFIFSSNKKMNGPRIYLAVGCLVNVQSKEELSNCIYNITFNFFHELSHYYQYINGISKSVRGLEWQATFYANRRIFELMDFIDEMIDLYWMKVESKTN